MAREKFLLLIDRRRFGVEDAVWSGAVDVVLDDFGM